MSILELMAQQASRCVALMDDWVDENDHPIIVEDKHIFAS